jgi:DNA-binding transcriptional ArsR family regulator
MMNEEIYAKAFKELGHPTRLAIFKRVIKAGNKGVAVGEIQIALTVPGSTLSHHIASLASAGLIKQRREGRVLYCILVPDMLLSIIDYLNHECCIDEGE